MDQDDFISNEELDANEWRALTKLVEAGFNFEPLNARPGVGEATADKLVDRGLAERGPSSPPYQGRGMPVGYKVSDLGWKVLDRGRFPQRR